MTTIHLEPNQVPQHLRSGYDGRKFKAEVCEQVTIPATAGLWDGGSRDTYSAVNLATGEQMNVPGQDVALFDKQRQSRNLPIVPGFAIVRHSIFCGQDTGLTFYVHPSNATAFLPAPTTLTPWQRLVLMATRSLKSSYGGRDRYEMAQTEYSCTKALGDTAFPTREQWEATKAELVIAGLLNKAGAITTKGRNAIG